MRIGVAHHFGWAVAVTADDRHEVVDRRRLELIDPGLPAAPIHHEGGHHDLHRTGHRLDDDALADLVSTVRASVVAATGRALDALAADVGSAVRSLSLRSWPDPFPSDVATLRRPPYEARADSVMYLSVLAEAATQRGWALHRFDARDVEAAAAAVLGSRADEVLRGPRSRLGAPWTKDHRMALAATVLAAVDGD